MVTRADVKLIPCQLHPYWLALVKWGEKHPYARIHIVLQDGIPMKALVPTDDGIGEEMILFRKVAQQVGLVK